MGLSVSYDRILELTNTFYEDLRQMYIIHNCFFCRIPRKSIFSVWLKIILMLTQKQISANQATMGLVHLLFGFKQPMINFKNFLQSHLGETSLKIKKNWYLRLLNIPQSKIYTLDNLKMNFGHLLLLVMCHQPSSHLTMQQLLKSSSGSLFIQKISR